MTPTDSDLDCRLFPFEVAGKKVELTNLENFTKLQVWISLEIPGSENSCKSRGEDVLGAQEGKSGCGSSHSGGSGSKGCPKRSIVFAGLVAAYP